MSAGYGTGNSGADDSNDITSSHIVTAFATLGGVDPSPAIESAKRFKTVKGWREFQMTQAGLAGAAAMAIPVAHLPAMALDVTFLIHKMAYCAWGIGAIHGATVEAKEDMALILALWSGAVKEETLPEYIAFGTQAGAFGLGVAGASYIAVKGAGGGAALAGKMTSKGVSAFSKGLMKAMIAKGATKGGAAGMALKLGGGASYIAGKGFLAPMADHLVQKAAAKIAAKIGAKISSKAVLGFVPLVGPVAGAAINGYFVSSLAKSADKYYTVKKQVETGEYEFEFDSILTEKDVQELRELARKNELPA